MSAVAPVELPRVKTGEFQLTCEMPQEEEDGIEKAAAKSKDEQMSMDVEQSVALACPVVAAQQAAPRVKSFPAVESRKREISDNIPSAKKLEAEPVVSSTNIVDLLPKPPKDIIYLDSAATTMVDPLVVEAMLPYFTAYYGNPASVHPAGVAAGDALKKCRTIVAKGINAPSDSDVYFLSGGTEVGDDDRFNHEIGQ